MIPLIVNKPFINKKERNEVLNEIEERLNLCNSEDEIKVELEQLESEINRLNQDDADNPNQICSSKDLLNEIIENRKEKLCKW